MKEFFYTEGRKTPLQRREGVFAITFKNVTSPEELLAGLDICAHLYSSYGPIEVKQVTDGTRKAILTAKDKTITVPQIRKGLSFGNVPYIASAYTSNGTHIYLTNKINVRFNKEHAAEKLEQLIDAHGLVFSEKAKFTPQGVNHYRLIVPKADDNKALLIANDIQESGIADSFPAFDVEIKKLH